MSTLVIPQPDDQQQWAWLARIRHAQGRKGEAFAEVLTDFPERFAERKQLWLIADPGSPRPRINPKQATPTDLGLFIKALRKSGVLAPAATPSKVELTRHWPHKGGIVLHFAGVASISDAEALAGLIVAVPEEQRAPLADDEVYIADLIGCTLFDVAATPPVAVGKIEDVDRTAGPVALLVINQPGSAEEVLVPFAKAFLRSIDLEGKRVEMALPEGLIGLNLPGKG